MQDKSKTIPSDWKVVRLIDIAKPIKDTVGDRKLETLSISAGIGFVNQANKFGKELSGKQYVHYTVIQRGDFSFNKGNSRRYPYGCIYMLRDRDIAAVPNAFYSFRIVGQYADYFEELFKFGYLNSQLKRLINTGVRDDGLFNLYEEDFYNCMVPLPPLDEQKKIAEILMTHDKVIALKVKSLEAKKKQKKWLMQKLFVNREWQIVKFEILFKRLLRKNTVGNGNVLTISANYGLISQESYFKKNIASSDLSNYFLLYKGDFAYNKSYSENYPYGAIKRLDKYEMGVVSPLYICFTPTSNNKCPEFYMHYFESLLLDSEIKSISQEGARNHGLLNIAIDDFFSMELPLPTLDEQQKIAEQLSVADKEIELLTQDLESQKSFKKYLMQQLLTGKIRV